MSKEQNPFLAPNYEAALEALTRGPMTSNAEGVLIRPVDQMAEAVRSLHEKNKTLHAVIAGDFNKKSFRKVCADNARLRTLLQEWNDLAQHQGLSTQAHRNRTAAALAAQPPAPGESTADQAFLDAFAECDDWAAGLSREQVRLIRERLAPAPGGGK